MIKESNGKYFICTKVRGIGKGSIDTGEVAKLKINAQPVIEDMATNPELVDDVYIDNMIIHAVFYGRDMIIGVLDDKYHAACAGKKYKIRNYQITGVNAHYAKEYMKLGLNIQFEISAEESKLINVRKLQQA